MQEPQVRGCVEKYKQATYDGDPSAYDDDDTIIMLFSLWYYLVSRLVGDPAWRASYDAATVKTRFLYSESNRKRVAQELNTIETMTKKLKLGQAWSGNFDLASGVVAYLQNWARLL